MRKDARDAQAGGGGTRAIAQWAAVLVAVVMAWELFEDTVINGGALPRRAQVQIRANPRNQGASGSRAACVGGNGGGTTGSWVAAPSTGSTGGAAAEVISSTGHLFSGDKVRSFDGPLVGTRLGTVTLSPATDSGPRCSNWSVVTTIHPASEAVLVAAALAGWCTVIVGDTKTPQNYLTPALKANLRVVFIPHDAPIAGAPGDAVGDYVRSVPFKHFARKNIGFLYAIQHGAEHIFDFDDDNILSGGMAPIPDGSSLGAVTRLVSRSTGAINPYPMLGATVEGSWPRGFPLQDINDKDSRGSRGPAFFLTPEELGHIGVWQSAADVDPDVDAVHRLTKNNIKPYTFTPVGKGPTVILPPGTFVPYNAQATVHTKPTLWATLLPMTVPGRVSDIWRGYFAQRIFEDLGLSMAYLPPRVHQNRNPHNFLADMQAEGALYFQTGKLLEFLHGWDGADGATTLPESIEKLWVAVYERGYIEREDVLAVQRWLKALVATGYVFPSPKGGGNLDRLTTAAKAAEHAQADSAAHGARKWPCNVIPPGTPPPASEHPDPSTITSKVMWPSASNIKLSWSGKWGDSHRAITGIGNRMIALIAGVIETVCLPGAALTFRDYNESDADTLWPALAALTVAPEKVENVEAHKWAQPGSNGHQLLPESLFAKFEQRRDVICKHFRFSTPPPPTLPGPDDIVVAFRTYANELDRLHGEDTKTYDKLLPIRPKQWPMYWHRSAEMPYAYYDRVIRKREYAKVWILVDPHNHEHPLVKRLIEVHNAEIHPGKSELEDFRFLSYANHIVLSPSTFYYLGAFLANNATIIHYGLGGAWPTAWCNIMMRHTPELRSRVQFHDIFSDRTWPQTEAGARDAHVYCTQWENDEAYSKGHKLNASYVSQIQTQYCEGMSCDVKTSPMIKVAGQPGSDDASPSCATVQARCAGHR